MIQVFKILATIFEKPYLTGQIYRFFPACFLTMFFC